jgi:hypothetical protein
MTIKCKPIFHSKALQNIPKMGFLVRKYTIWQPCQRHRSGNFDGQMRSKYIDKVEAGIPMSTCPSDQCYNFWNSFEISGVFSSFCKICILTLIFKKKKTKIGKNQRKYSSNCLRNKHFLLNILNPVSKWNP